MKEKRKLKSVRGWEEKELKHELQTDHSWKKCKPYIENAKGQHETQKATAKKQKQNPCYCDNAKCKGDLTLNDNDKAIPNKEEKNPTQLK